MPTGVTQGPFFCGFVDKASATAAAPVPKAFGDGGVVNSQTQQRNADGGRMLSALCTVSGFPKGGGAEQTLIVGVDAIGVRPDLDKKAVNTRSAGYVFPQSYGVGSAALRDPSDRSQGADADLLRGNWHVSVGLMTSPKGRDPVQDAVAIARQVIAFLRLPTTHAKPYPSTSSS